MKKKLSYVVDYDGIHQAFAALDAVRHGHGISVGRQGCFDALGGTYCPGEYSGVSGLVCLHRALDTITSHGWDVIHGASKRVDDERESYAKSQWMVEYRHRAHWCVLTRKGDCPRGFASHRGAAIVAGRMNGRVRPAADLLRERVGRIHEQVRVAVRVLLRARACYDALAAAGATGPHSSPRNSVMAGHDGEHLHATGLRWLAGASSEDAPVTVNAAQAFADGADVSVFIAA